MAQGVFKVSSTAEAYWLAVDENDLTVVDGQAAVDLASGPHTLVWWMLGNPGSGIDLSVEQDGDEIASAGSRVPQGFTQGAGYLHFEID